MLLNRTTTSSITTSAATAVPVVSLRCYTQRVAPPLIPSYCSASPRALFHTSPSHLKKGKAKSKGGGGGAAAATAESSADKDDDEGGGKHPAPNPEDPLNFADVQSRIKQQDEHFTSLLKKLRSGGRFNADVIGALRVAAPDAPKGSGATYALRELAQVVPRPGGRYVSILAHEPGSIKAIMSAVQASPDFNQQPQREPDNELELVLKVEPESRDETARRLKATCNEWRERIRAIRRRRDKVHANWLKEAVLGPDSRRTATKNLDNMIKAKMSEIDDAEKEALKAAEGGK